MSDKPWYVSIPIDELLRLQQLVPEVERLQKENVQLRREVEGLRSVQNQSLLKFAEILRNINDI